MTSWDGAGLPREHLIRGLGCEADGALTYEVDGRACRATLRMEGLRRRMLADIPDVAHDLITVAAHVYAGDAAIGRGGPTDPGMGALWRRSLRFEIPVRRPDLWSSDAATDALREVVDLLSGDDAAFEFQEDPDPGPAASFLQFREEDGARPDEVLMFSGGLDSFAGALDELRRGSCVALVSHRSSTKMAPVQDKLVRHLVDTFGPRRVMHVPVTMQVGEKAGRESTHRTRSFLFAALGVAVGRMLSVDRVRFHENGVVSVNLPISGQVVGSRATRSTHPLALAALSRLASVVVGEAIRIENPLLWQTKTEVLELIRSAGSADMIRHTRSCGELRHMTRAHPHCGLCSQCIDRRFAALAAGLEDEDPAEAYAVDPLEGPREKAPQREMALGYVRNARAYASISDEEFLASFGELQRAARGLDLPAGAAMERLVNLHRKHGRAVSRVLAQRLAAVAGSRRDPADPDSLVMMAGRDVFAGGAGEEAAAAVAVVGKTDAPPPPVMRTLTLGADGRSAMIAGLGSVKGSSAEVLHRLATDHLLAVGDGLAPEDHPFVPSRRLAADWNISEEGVRRRVLRLRNEIAALPLGAGAAAPDAQEIVESIPWQGYRLAPDTVRVVRERSTPASRRRSGKGPPKTPSSAG